MKRVAVFFIYLSFFLISLNSYGGNISKKDLFAAAKSAERQGDYVQAKKYYTELAELSDNPQITSFILKKIDSLDTLNTQASDSLSVAASYEQKMPLPSTDINVSELTTPINQARALEEQGKIKEANEMYNSIVNTTSSNNVKNFAKKRIAILLAKENSLKGKRSPLETKKTKEIVEPFLTEEQSRNIEEKISKARFLIQSGDTFYNEGKIEEAFKMYRFAVEALT
ncbi:MAG: hypothetical protein PHQ52_00050 [Candidatus Omnitrophica bacterium]|nr:hypothetical protein [Candidatus Omnitrophota bacterium]